MRTLLFLLRTNHLTSPIDDIVRGVISAIEKYENVKGGTFNLASGTSVRLSHVAEQIKKLFESEDNAVIKENRPRSLE